MVNTRLKALLDRCPLGEEDCHNIGVIFSALTPERQQYILDNWDTYIVEMVMLRKEIDKANRLLLEETLEVLDTIKDAKTAQEAEMKIAKYLKQKQTRLELESVQKYEQNRKFQLISSMAQVH
jgi:hypothetical protein